MSRLSDHTTLHLGGPACSWVTATTEDELTEAVRTADGPVLILGGGSNLVVCDEGFPGTVVRVATRGITFTNAGDEAEVTVAAGEPWDAVVAAAIDAGLAGLECLSGIPGSAGATPIQNVGAYGAEVAEVVTTVRVFDRLTAVTSVIPNEACHFAYRTSLLKRIPDRYVVLSVTFRLPVSKLSGPVRYPDLASELGVQTGEQAAAAEVRSAVLNVRRRKGMVLDPADPDTRSAGSFFTNPVIPAEHYARLAAAAAGQVPKYDAGDGQVKVPAAWLIENAGFTRGYAITPGGARISTKHTLALVNPGDATTAGLIDLARTIRDGVHAAFGVTLSPEPTLIGVTL